MIIKNLIKKAKYLRNNLTREEKIFWYHLRNKNLGIKFRRQQPIGRYIVDFVNFNKKIIIELDGGQHNRQIQYDKTRDEWLKSQGYIILRFWNNEVNENIDGVLKKIIEVID